MNCNELKNKVSIKDAEIKSKKDFSIEVFNRIKDTCLEIVQNKAIDDNFDGEFWLHDNEIMRAIEGALKLDFSEVYFDSSWVHGVESQDVYICSRSSINNLMLSAEATKLKIMALQEDDESRKDKLISLADGYTDTYKRITKKESEARDLIKKMDYPLLCVMLRSHIIGSGFYGVTKTHRYTNKKCRLLIFTTTRNKLLKSTCCSDGGNGDLKENLIGACLIVVLAIFALIFFCTQ